MSVVIQGRAAFAQLLRLLAEHVEDGSIEGPVSIVPAPHLGPYCVRASIDYDLAAELPGITPDPAADDPGDTMPGKRQPARRGADHQA